ncbi:MAG: hypothetical protein ACRDM0_00405 [Thermoleophilaceae bacterium]
MGASAFVLAALVLSSAAAAFSCVQVHPRHLIGWGIVVAEGEVQSSSALGARVRVDRVYEGSANRTITVWPGRWDPVRGVDFPWTFYLQPMFFMYVATDCGGSHPGNLTQVEQEFFGEGRPPSPDEPFLGVFGTTAVALAIGAFVWRLRARRQTLASSKPEGQHPIPQ